MLEWSRVKDKTRSQFKVAHIQELFRFFLNKNQPNYSFGKVNTLVLKHNFNVELSKTMRLQSVLDYNYIEADGSSFGNPNRNAFSATVLLNSEIKEGLNYGINIRKDVVSDFKSPFLFSLDAGYKITKHYTLKVNASKNFRIPTINDLYWRPGGNINLVPEESYQLDLGQVFNYKFLDFKLNTFYITTDNLIQWQPDNNGIWSPLNITETENYGIEAELSATKQFNKHNIKLSSNYSYTVSENKATKKQLIYVPFHKGNISLAYSNTSFSMYYQHLFNGGVFITDDNLEGQQFSLPNYDVANFGVNYTFLNKENHRLELGVSVNNIYNEAYQNVASRPMPNRNFNIQIQYKF